MPNLFPQDPAVQVTANRGANVDAALQQRVEASLKKAGVPFASSTIGKDGNLMVRTGSADAQSRASQAIRDELATGYVIALSQASTVPAWLQALPSRMRILVHQVPVRAQIDVPVQDLSNDIPHRAVRG